MTPTVELFSLIALLVVCAAFCIGITWAPCYATLCSEEFYPVETRIHIAVFYALLASVACFLLLRAYNPTARRWSGYHLTKKEVPLAGKRLSLGGLLLGVWIITIVLITTAYWEPVALRYFGDMVEGLDWDQAKIRLAVTNIIGHHVDHILGIVIIPVGRNSILGRVFKVHQSTLLYAHKFFAYLLLIGTAAHGAAYYTFVGEYAAAPDDSPRKAAFNIDNPTLTQAEADAKSPWFKGTLPTGMIAFLGMLVITITALPYLRRMSYNTFYYTHIIGSLVVFLTACWHADTDFYCLLPGLLLWVADWAWRLFAGSQGGLRKRVDGTLANAGEGWYRISLPLPAKLPSSDTHDAADVERAVEKGKSPSHPLQSYYLSFPAISKVQNHAFTAAKIGSPLEGPTFLLQRAGGGKKQAKLNKEWTWKLGSLVPEPMSVAKGLQVRVEGPYIPDVPGLFAANHLVCIVGGTGVTGALSTAYWWLDQRSRDPSARLSVLWTVRHEDTARLDEWAELVRRCEGMANAQLLLRVTSNQGRADLVEYLTERMGDPASLHRGSGDKEALSSNMGSSTWVYVSGPDSLLRTAETACIQIEKGVRREGRTMEWYVAKWEV